jgi:two-component system sensor histidine kinase DesK
MSAPTVSAATGTARRGFRYGWVFAAVWLYYLSENVGALLAHPPGWASSVGFAALGAFVVAYLLLISRVRFSGPARLGERWAGIVLLLGLTALQVPGAGYHALTCLVYVVALAMMGLPMRQAVAVTAVLFLAAEILTHTLAGWQDNGFGMAVVLACAAVYGMRLAVQRNLRLLAAQQELADLAVMQERARIATDLHDILGHSLTVVTVKAELAQRLLDVDVEKARAELRDLEMLARDALSDVRTTAMGVRGISLPGEIAAARSALAAAHVTAELPGAADEVPSRWRELFAWTIREAVTNIVRHARATRCEVRLTPASVEILDDGAGPAAAAADGQGLAGLRSRAAELGATLSVGPRDDTTGFRVRVEVPA